VEQEGVMSELPSFGAWMKRRRKALDLTQHALAQRVGCSVVSIRKIEGETQRPSRQLAVRLAEQLQIAPGERQDFIRYARFGLDATPPEPSLPAELRVPASRPPGTSPGRYRSNLHVPRTTLVGRAADIAAVCALLRDDVALLTLTGPGGVGKTRLAVAAAAQLEPAFADGVSVVDFAPIRDPALVAGVIAQTLGVRETTGLSLLESLCAWLRDKHLLLLLDNFEQVRDAAPLLADILAAAPRCRILVTSRATLALSGEHEFQVRPLAYPKDEGGVDRNADGESLHPSSLILYPSVALFVARAQAVHPGFALTNANALVVAEICERLDGLPLAIELAAARIRLLPPQQLLERLEQRLSLLTGGARDLPVRQQTLRNTIRWGYDLLDPGRRALFRRLAVFQGGWTLDAATVVCNAGGDRSVDVLDGLTALLDHSLLRQEEDSNGYPRFSMLATIHEFALELFVASGEAEALRRRHAAYFLALAEQAEPALAGAEALAWLARLEVESDNLRAALEHGSRETVVRMSAALADFWLVRDRRREGERWLAAALPLSDGLPAKLRARVRAAYGRLLQWWGDQDLVRQLLEESQLLYRELDEARGVASVGIRLGEVALARGFVEHAYASFAESLAIAQAEREHRLIAWALFGLGRVAEQQGHHERSCELGRESLALFRAVGDKLGSAWALNMLARIAALTGSYAVAEGHQEERLAVERELNHKEGMAATSGELAGLAMAQGNYAAAASHLAQALRLWRELGVRQQIAQGLEGFAQLALAQGQGERAARLLGAAAALRAGAWDAGCSVTLDQAIDEALDGCSAGSTPPKR
jgi:predicted ATPase/transcriptional regulator with XRE-family HTH domain